MKKFEPGFSHEKYLSRLLSTNKLKISLEIDDFGVSDAILFEGPNSGQTSIKSFSLACDVEPPLLKTVRI